MFLIHYVIIIAAAIIIIYLILNFAVVFYFCYRSG